MHLDDSIQKAAQRLQRLQQQSNTTVDRCSKRDTPLTVGVTEHSADSCDSCSSLWLGGSAAGHCDGDTTAIADATDFDSESTTTATTSTSSSSSSSSEGPRAGDNCRLAAGETPAVTNSPRQLPDHFSYRPPAHLISFLEQPGAPPPIYIGFGSCVLGGAEAAERMARLIAAAVKQAGVRAVLATGWAGAGSSSSGGGGSRGGGRVGGTRSSSGGGGGGGDAGSSCCSSDDDSCSVGSEVAGKNDQLRLLAEGAQDSTCLIDEMPHSFIFPK